MRVIHLTSAGSTNAEARKLASGSEFGPLWIRADAQTQGRGRSGRDWVSPKDNLYTSYLFPVDGPVHQFGHFSFVAAIAVQDCLAHYFPEGDFGLKWPNDCLLGDAKISGLLLETGKTHHQYWIVIGIGINLVSHPEGTPYPATNLSSHMPEKLPPETVQAVLAAKMAHWIDIYEQKGFSAIREAWLEKARNIPGPVSVRLPNETFTGHAIDLDRNGALQVQLANGSIRDVHAGDVYLG